MKFAAAAILLAAPATCARLRGDAAREAKGVAAGESERRLQLGTPSLTIADFANPADWYIEYGFDDTAGKQGVYEGDFSSDGRLLEWMTPLFPLLSLSPPSSDVCSDEDLVTNADDFEDTLNLLADDTTPDTWSPLFTNGFSELPHCAAGKVPRHTDVQDMGIFANGECCKDCAEPGVEAWARTYLYSNTNQDVDMGFVANDGAVLWVNDVRVATDNRCSLASTTEAAKNVKNVSLIAGWNKIDVLVRNQGSTGPHRKGMGFVLRIMDTGRITECALGPLSVDAANPASDLSQGICTPASG